MKRFFVQEIDSSTFKCILFIGLLVISFKNRSFSQEAARPVYFSFAYIKTMPGKNSVYEQMIASYTQKVFSKQVQDGNMIGWFLYKVLSPGGTQAEYNYVGIIATHDLQSIFEPERTFRQAFQKTFPAMEAKKMDEIFNALNGVRSFVKYEIYTNYALAAPVRDKPFTYAWWAFQQALPGKLDQSLQWEKNNWTAIHQASMELGGLGNWGVYTLYMPRSLNEQYQYLTVNFFDDFKQFTDGFRYNDALKKAYPGMDFTKLFALPGGDKKVYRSELLKMIAYATTTANLPEQTRR